jgi:acyl-CoA thioesterase-2
MRHRDRLPDEPGVHEGAITFMSDIGAHYSARLPILGPAPRASTSGVMSVSIDHAVWFHAPARADEWLYYELQALTHQGSRAVTRGRFYAESGRLVASVTQEVLIRMLAAKPPLGAVN